MDYEVTLNPELAVLFDYLEEMAKTNRHTGEPYDEWSQVDHLQWENMVLAQAILKLFHILEISPWTEEKTYPSGSE